VHRVICVNNYSTRCNNIQFIYIWKLLYVFRVVSPPIIRSSYHCIYSIWHYWDRYCHLSWTWRSRQVAVTVSIMSDTVDAVIWAPDDGWRYHSKHIEQFADVNKLYIVASCWIIIDTYFVRFIYSRFHENPSRSRQKNLIPALSNAREGGGGGPCSG